MMTREQFVQLCTQLIQQARDDITIANQLDGYKKCHRELKENHIIEKYRNIQERYEKKHDKYDPINQQRMIKEIGIGRCAEMATYLIGQFLLAFKAKKIEATLRNVSSRTHDHVYVHIIIRLFGERKISHWEIDSWDPRLIDITRGPNGLIKNKDKLTYGSTPQIDYETRTDAYHPWEKTPRFFKAKPGESKRYVTPEKEMLRKHSWLYGNHTLEAAYIKDELDSLGEICEPQRKSRWQ